MPKRVETESCYAFDGCWNVRTVKGGSIMNREETEFSETSFGLPHLPDMTFPKHLLEISHVPTRALIKFDPFSALECVDTKLDTVRVSYAEEWLASRKNLTGSGILHHFDWTFTPRDYCGKDSDFRDVSSTELRINYEKLKEREPISFYDEVILYEDELDDNGSSSLSVKIRGMESGVFCLMRFYLRIDNTMVRVIDTRHYIEKGKPYILREYVEKEERTANISVPLSVLKDVNQISNHLPTTKERFEILHLKES